MVKNGICFGGARKQNALFQGKMCPKKMHPCSLYIEQALVNTEFSLIYMAIQILLNNNLIENIPTNKSDSFFIKHTSSDFHEVSCKDQTNNSETLAQAVKTSALMNHSHVSNDVFYAFYIDYIEFKKYVDDIINSLNAKKEVCRKSGSNNNQSKLNFQKQRS